MDLAELGTHGSGADAEFGENVFSGHTMGQGRMGQ